MKKLYLAAAAALTLSMVWSVSADDVVVRTSVGSGEIVFTETSEAANISGEELTKLVKGAMADLESKEKLELFMDGEVDIKLTMGSEDSKETTNPKGSIIGSFDRNGSTLSGNFYCGYEAFGDSASLNLSGYSWEKDGTKYTAISKDRGEWKVKAVDASTMIFDELEEALESDTADEVTLDYVLPNLYEEGGRKYYVCLYDDKEKIVEASKGIEKGKAYLDLAYEAYGDNEVKLIMVIDAQTGIPRAMSIDGSGAKGSMTGSFFGTKGDLSYDCSNCYFTVLMSDQVGEIEIPEEVLSAPVTESGLKEALGRLGNLISSLGIFN